MKERMESPFIYDPFAIVFQAFKNLYPDKECFVEWQPEEMVDDNGNGYVGMTTFADDGNAYVEISIAIPVKDAVETLAHELAHVAAGEEEAHGEKWENAFTAIHAEYDRIGDEMFGTDTRVAVTVSDGMGGYDPDPKDGDGRG